MPSVVRLRTFSVQSARPDTVRPRPKHPARSWRLRIGQPLARAVIGLGQALGPSTAVVEARRFRVSSQVFHPGLFGTTRLMARHVAVVPGADVLDVGTGSGVLAVLAAATARRVVAVDCNSEALRWARYNVQQHHLGARVDVRQGDLFDALRPQERFDLVLFNPPYLEGRPRTRLQQALFDPQKQTITRFFGRAHDHLKTDGIVLLAYSSLAEYEYMLELARKNGWSHRCIARHWMGIEWIFVYRFTSANSWHS